MGCSVFGIQWSEFHLKIKSKYGLIRISPSILLKKDPPVYNNSIQLCTKGKWYTTFLILSTRKLIQTRLGDNWCMQDRRDKSEHSTRPSNLSSNSRQPINLGQVMRWETLLIKICSIREMTTTVKSTNWRISGIDLSRFGSRDKCLSTRLERWRKKEWMVWWHYKKKWQIEMNHLRYHQDSTVLSNRYSERQSTSTAEIV